jgi:hypothetical protein
MDGIPERVTAVLDLPAPRIGVPERLVELIGAGPNGWTAQEGALKVREEPAERATAPPVPFGGSRPGPPHVGPAAAGVPT